MDPHSPQNSSDSEISRGLELCEQTHSNLTEGRNHPKLRIQLPEPQYSTSREEEPKASVSNPSDKAHGSARTAIGSTSFLKRNCNNKLLKLKHLLPFPDLSWINNNLDATHFKPVIRTTVATWICIVLLVIPATEKAMGQASFLVLVAAFLSPPAEPFIAVFEREMAILLFVNASFAWTCLGIRVANLARKEFNTSASVNDIFAGRYLEAWPAIICAIFLFVGTAVLLYTKARVGPGPYSIATVLSCIMMDISFTTGHLYPYTSYKTGESIAIPIAVHSAVSLVCSIFVLPETVNAQFIKRFRGVFVPLSKAMRTQPDLFATPAMSDAFDPGLFFKHIAAAEAALAPLAASSRLLKKDFSWGRFGSKDFSRLHEIARRMTVRANGMAFYFKIIDPVVDKQPGFVALSVVNTPLSTPAQSRAPTRPPSPTPSHSEVNTPSNVSIVSTTRPRNRHRQHSLHHSIYHHLHGQSHSPHHRHMLSMFGHPTSLFQEAISRSTGNAVGVFESQRYLNLESRLAHPDAGRLTEHIMELLGESTDELLACCADTLDHLAGWLERMNQDRFWKLFRRERLKTWKESIRDDEAVKDKLRRVLDEFREKKRHRVLDMYRSYLDPDHVGSPPAEDVPPHRYLFQSYLYQYHLTFFSEHLYNLLEEITRLEKTRARSRLWFPVLPLKKILTWSKWEPTETNLQQNEDEDPDIIQGIDPETQDSLGQAERRDPDALPPGNISEAIGNVLYHAVGALGRGNAIFGFKAGILSVLLSLPNFLPSSTHFAYVNRSIWALVIGQLTLSRFRGDTTFGWFSRVMSTFFGGLVGMVMWYTSTGLGDGNAFGLAAVCAVGFPFLFFIRLNYPAPAMTLTIFLVTVGLVVGYSWQDEHFPTLSNQGKGIHVAWVRFVLVTIGVTVAFIFSYLPPSTTLRRYLRTTYATTSQQLGQAYCDVVSYATLQDGPYSGIIVKDLIAIRLKLRRSLALMTNVTYEYSLRGKWPKERYNTVYEIQMEIAYLLSHLRSVTEHLELSWAQAFLKRTRFLEPDFQGDVLAVISMISTALRTGTPLPQVTPCPLLDRFVAHSNGLNVLRKEEEGDYGLPRTLTIETLEDEQYLYDLFASHCATLITDFSPAVRIFRYFSVGVSTAFGIVTRLDRLMMATKELVGEQFHIHGLPVHVAKAKSVP
ncbi:hypothetical protein DFH11DRAFT_1880050 [Phellopilus nigrolimitatus]|nr:hypothetical protein DFH11DRAFT_1880050 [Phellopilus nigrolimitatus]